MPGAAPWIPRYARMRMTLAAEPGAKDSAAIGRLPRAAWRLVGNLLARLQDRLELARSRRALLTLDDRMLADIGVDRATAKTEGERGFWG
jgi:uncharacterized protein YjiS (DUF1127 family)